MQSVKADDLPENPRENSNPFAEMMFWYVFSRLTITDKMADIALF